MARERRRIQRYWRQLGDETRDIGGGGGRSVPVEMLEKSCDSQEKGG
jgi:hypothetical protein